jgi:hypothetical protein
MQSCFIRVHLRIGKAKLLIKQYKTCRRYYYPARLRHSGGALLNKAMAVEVCDATKAIPELYCLIQNK